MFDPLNVVPGEPVARAQVMAKTVKDLLVYQKAMAAAHELRKLLELPTFRRDLDLQGQLNRASIRVVSDISEGFEQKTDRHFTRYLYDARVEAARLRHNWRSQPSEYHKRMRNALEICDGSHEY